MFPYEIFRCFIKKFRDRGDPKISIGIFIVLEKVCVKDYS